MRHKLRYIQLLFVVVGAALVLTGCTGQATNATELTPTSATLGARGTCDTKCSYYFRVYDFTASRWIDGPVRGPVGRIRSATAFTEKMSLQPGRDYAYQVCGYGDGLTRTVCVGPDNKEDTYSYFSTPTHSVTHISGGVTTLRSGSLGRAVHDRALAGGAQLFVTTATSTADYSAPYVRVNPSLRGNSLLPGILAHELGHALIAQRGVDVRINRLPDNLGTVVNEIIAEMLASAAARQGGWARGESAVTDAAGNLRSARGALDNILQTGYVDYYGINLANVSEADRQLAADTAFNEAFGLIQAMGGTVPKEYRP